MLLIKYAFIGVLCRWEGDRKPMALSQCQFCLLNAEPVSSMWRGEVLEQNGWWSYCLSYYCCCGAGPALPCPSSTPHPSGSGEEEGENERHTNTGESRAEQSVEGQDTGLPVE